MILETFSTIPAMTHSICKRVRCTGLLPEVLHRIVLKLVPSQWPNCVWPIAVNGADVAANAEAVAPAEDEENEADTGVRLRGPTRQEQIRRATVALVPDIDRTVPGKDRLSLCPLPATLSYVTAPFDENTYDPAEDEAEAKRQRGGKDGDHARALTHLRWKFVGKEEGTGVEPSTAASSSS